MKAGEESQTVHSGIWLLFVVFYNFRHPSADLKAVTAKR